MENANRITHSFHKNLTDTNARMYTRTSISNTGTIGTRSMLKTLRSREQQKTTSLQSLKTSQDEVEMGLKRMKDELNGWQRKKDLAVLRQWLRWWHFRARAISRGVRKISEQNYFVERFRKSALATGVMEGMMRE